MKKVEEMNNKEFYEEMRKKVEQYNRNRLKWHRIRKKLKEIKELLKAGDKYDR